MVRHTTTLAVLVAALWSTACSVHISTGPSSPVYTSAPAQPNGIVWAKAPRPQREQRDPGPRDRSDSETPRKERPNRQFDAADEMMANAGAHRTPRQLEPTKDRGVAPIATPSHTDRKPPRDVGHGVTTPGNGHGSDDRPQMVGGGQGDSGGKSPAAWRKRLPRGDGRLQQVAKQ